MSSILLSNPFVTAPPPSQAATEGLVTTTALAAVAPAQTGANARGAGDAASHDGAGSGKGRNIGSASQQAFLAERRGPLKASRPPNATANSVIDAQARDAAFQTGAKADARDAGLRPRPLGPDALPALPGAVVEAEMPDPLPTSPFLKMMSGRG